MSEKQKDTILYIDDDDCNLLLFSDFMSAEYNVIIANSASQAVQLLKEHPVKVLIADLRMPDESGLEFIDRITPEYPQLIKIGYFD